MRILVAEDDTTISGQICSVLTAEGRAVDIASDGEEALYLGSTEPYDLAVLDLGLPSRDGISILKEWRRSNVEIPVLILTARNAWSDRVDGLDAGADDYITKPFHMPELSARIRAMLRRQARRANPIFQKGPVVFDSRSGHVTVDGMPVTLTAQEVAVLSYLLHNAGRFVTRSELSDHIYPYDGDRDSNTIAVFINRLRNKLGSALIATERGRGYKIDLD